MKLNRLFSNLEFSSKRDRWEELVAKLSNYGLSQKELSELASVRSWLSDWLQDCYPYGKFIPEPDQPATACPGERDIDELVCFKCGIPLQGSMEVYATPASSSTYWHCPYPAVHFRGGSNYGSTFFDDLHGDFQLELLICDDCLIHNPNLYRVVKLVNGKWEQSSHTECRNPEQYNEQREKHAEFMQTPAGQDLLRGLLEDSNKDSIKNKQHARATRMAKDFFSHEAHFIQGNNITLREMTNIVNHARAAGLTVSYAKINDETDVILYHNGGLYHKAMIDRFLEHAEWLNKKYICGNNDNDS